MYPFISEAFTAKMVYLFLLLITNVGNTGYEAGYWMLDIGYWILDIGYWILDIGYWILDSRYLT
jgi:hypothetical protein